MYILRWQTMKTTFSNGNVMDSRMTLLDLQWKNSNYNGWKEQFFSCEFGMNYILLFLQCAASIKLWHIWWKNIEHKSQDQKNAIEVITTKMG